MKENKNINLQGENFTEDEGSAPVYHQHVESEREPDLEYNKSEFYEKQAEVGESEESIKPKRLTSALDDISDRLNNKFDKMDVRKKGTILLTGAAIIFIVGMVYLYIFLSQLF